MSVHPRRPAGTTTVKEAPAKRWSKPGFVAQVNDFLRNKAVIESLTLTNLGDKKHEVPGLRDSLLAQTRAHGERDPETQSVFLRLDEPIIIDTNRVQVVKAEARGAGKKEINLERAVALLKMKTDEANQDADPDDPVDYVEECTKYQVTLPLMDTEQYQRFVKAMKRARLDTDDVVVNDLLDEDSILGLHYDGDILSEADIDTIYDPVDITWALTFQA